MIADCRGTENDEEGNAVLLTSPPKESLMARRTDKEKEALRQKMFHGAVPYKKWWIPTYTDGYLIVEDRTRRFKTKERLLMKIVGIL